MAQLAVNLVTYNGTKYLPGLFESLRSQTFRDWEIFVYDNGSTDETVAMVKNELNKLSVRSFFEVGQENLGFVGGHNRLYCLSDAPYLLILNQDVILEYDCLKKMINFMSSGNASAVSPRLMKYDNKGIVDSLGLSVLRNRQVVDRFSGQKWIDKKFYQADLTDDCCQPPTKPIAEVFGVSATCALYRRSALERVAYDIKELFSADYFAYKEDVDLAYRLRSAGFCSYILLNVVVHHDRSAFQAGSSDAQMAKNKAGQSDLVKYHSYKNHLATLYKNEYWQNLFIDFLPVLWYEFKKFAYFLLFDRQVLRGLIDLWNGRKELFKKRRWIFRNRKLTWREMRKWWKV